MVLVAGKRKDIQGRRTEQSKGRLGDMLALAQADHLWVIGREERGDLVAGLRVHVVVHLGLAWSGVRDVRGPGGHERHGRWRLRSLRVLHIGGRRVCRGRGLAMLGMGDVKDALLGASSAVYSYGGGLSTFFISGV